MTATRHYDQDAWNRIMAPDAESFEADLQVEGALPPSLQGGTYLLNGPAMVKLGGKLMHPFDGHGYLRAVRFSGGQARLQARFVETPEWRAEKAAGALKFRGIGTTVGGWLSNAFATKAKNTANTCVVSWGGQLLCLYEGGLPYALDPDTLETKGIETFGGGLDGELAFHAHTRFDHARNRLVGVSIKPGPKTRYRFVEIDESNAIVAEATWIGDQMSLIHDFVVTPSYYLIIENPVDPDVAGFAKMLLGMGTLIECLGSSDKPARLIAIPRSGGEPKVVSLDRPMFAVHHAGAWEDGERLTFDTCCFDSFTFGREFGYAGPDAPLDPGIREVGAGQLYTRFEVDLGTGQVDSRVLSQWSMDFPRIHPHRDGLPYRVVAAATSVPQGVNDPFNALIVVDLEAGTEQVWAPGDGCFVGEPVVAPRPGTDSELQMDVLAMVYDGREGSCYLGIFDPATVEQGPIAKVVMPRLLPYGFHGAWVR